MKGIQIEKKITSNLQMNKLNKGVKDPYNENCKTSKETEDTKKWKNIPCS